MSWSVTRASTTAVSMGQVSSVWYRGVAIAPSWSGIGSPWGSTAGRPSISSMRSIRRSEAACSNRSASSWTSAQLIPTTSTRKSSISRWRRSTRAASFCPAAVSLTPA